MPRKTDDSRAGEIAERLRRYRLERGWTQSQLATRAGLSRTTVGRVELGLERPHGRTAEQLATALGVEVDRLLGLDGQPALFPLPDELRMDVVKRVAALTDAEIERVHGALRRVLDAASEPRRPRRRAASAEKAEA